MYVSKKMFKEIVKEPQEVMHKRIDQKINDAKKKYLIEIGVSVGAGVIADHILSKPKFSKFMPIAIVGAFVIPLALAMNMEEKIGYYKGYRAGQDKTIDLMAECLIDETQIAETTEPIVED